VPIHGQKGKLKMNLRKAAELALERLESHEYWMDEEAIQALRTALAQPEREWVGLTDAEIEEIADWTDNNAAPWYLEYAYAIEAKLKEKNR
jgi:hypothetical protein